MTTDTNPGKVCLEDEELQILKENESKKLKLSKSIFESLGFQNELLH